ncbi:MAG: S8 family serine peptidase [Phycisphaerae bacterium]|nr:S8 family serine peptidase [Phycisphaerae bacterium]
MHRCLCHTWILTLGCFLASLIVGCTAGPAGKSEGKVQVAGSPDEPRKKIQITRLDDLPQHTYPFSGKVADLARSDAQIAELAAKVRADIEADLATYEIGDATTLQNMHGTLLSINLLEGNHEAALALIDQIRRLEKKEAKKLTTGLTTEAMIAARREVGETAKMSAYRQAFGNQLADRVAKLPWDIVQDEIQQRKGRIEILSEKLLLGVIQAQLEPVIAQTGELNADQTANVIGMHFTLKELLPLKQQIITVYQGLIDTNKSVKPDIWAERSVTLSEGDRLTPVLVAVWDSGTDGAVFADRLFVNPGETMDGKDDDGNGYVDDVHGIAFDIHARRSTGVLCPLGDAAERMPQVMKHMKGFMDIQAAVDSPEASALKQHVSSLDPADVGGFIEDLRLAGDYAHGTHVAGIIAAGNPFVRLLIARLSYDYRMVPVARTVEWGERDAAKCRDTVEYFKLHGVRLVNMSWGEAQQDAEDSLGPNGIGKDAEERREIARKVFALQKEGLHEAIAGAPDILFVCAAGNADNDVEFDQYIPSSFDLPNLLTIGAVDQAGDATSFTSFGRTVQVYANGFEVDSYVPGGERMKMSGTSMASPNAANLAAKLLAIDPSLTPPQVIELMKEGADKKTAGKTSFLLLNPKRTVELLKSRR